ncbi:hypothetical protein GY45DRAFT_1265328 [Cubamyces sp. BRFM 1775]|nr:hypothetical protein GY45DRAFT_1265328 [Cubamyces sp. BRFM 1775]
MIFTLYALLVATAALGAPMASLDADTFLQNGKDAQVLNAEFASLNASDSCTTGDLACMGTSIAQCVNGTWQTEECPKSLFCFALPSVREEGTVLSCTTNATAVAVINASGATGGLFANSTKDSVDFPTDCGDDDDNDGSGTQSSSTTASATPTQTDVNEGSATQTASASASFSTATATVVSSSPISIAGTNNTADATITVTVTAPASASTQFSETTVLDPAQASSFLSSIATDTNFSIVTTILPTSTSAGVTATTTAASSSGEARNSAFSSTPVGIASNPASSFTSNTGAPTTITLVPRPSSVSQSATAQTTAAADNSY